VTRLLEALIADLEKTTVTCERLCKHVPAAAKSRYATAIPGRQYGKYWGRCSLMGQSRRDPVKL
jgi:hypothetical protein